MGLREFMTEIGDIGTRVAPTLGVLGAKDPRELTDAIGLLNASNQRYDDEAKLAALAEGISTGTISTLKDLQTAAFSAGNDKLGVSLAPGVISQGEQDATQTANLKALGSLYGEDVSQYPGADVGMLGKAFSSRTDARTAEALRDRERLFKENVRDEKRQYTAGLLDDSLLRKQQTKDAADATAQRSFEAGLNALGLPEDQKRMIQAMGPEAGLKLVNVIAKEKFKAPGRTPTAKYDSLAAPLGTTYNDLITEVAGTTELQPTQAASLIQQYLPVAVARADGNWRQGIADFIKTTDYEGLTAHAGPPIVTPPDALGDASIPTPQRILGSQAPTPTGPPTGTREEAATEYRALRAKGIDKEKARDIIRGKYPNVDFSK